MPKTHGFLIDIHNRFKIMEGQVDISPKVMDSKITFEEAREQLTMALLKLLRSTGSTEVSREVEQMIVETSTTEDSQMQTRQMVARKAKTLIDKLNTEEMGQQTSTEISIEPQNTQEVLAPTVGSRTANDRDKETAMRIPQKQSEKQVKLTFRNIIADIRRQGPEECINKFNEQVGKFQMEMQREVREKAISIESLKFVPPTGYVPTNLTLTQFKKVSKVFTRKDRDLKAK